MIASAATEYMKSRKIGLRKKAPEQAKSTLQRIQTDYRIGLDARAVEQRRLCGLTNHAVAAPSRTVGRICFDNIYTLFNIALAFCFVHLIQVFIKYMEPHLHKTADRIGKRKSM